ncbi:hypothetical protein D623_10004124 [Myotis brandtii]|uniref:Uncharacterized protein n=1 Tax=Myotis brandtii TaxID=109478 RepID=S7MBI3_MYOBR|nr:hypothetical protein D623_10004124 [Myotis brandtii]
MAAPTATRWRHSVPSAPPGQQMHGKARPARSACLPRESPRPLSPIATQGRPEAQLSSVPTSHEFPISPLSAAPASSTQSRALGVSGPTGGTQVGSLGLGSPEGPPRSPSLLPQGQPDSPRRPTPSWPPLGPFWAPCWEAQKRRPFPLPQLDLGLKGTSQEKTHPKLTLRTTPSAQ